ncbi:MULTISPECIES: hypothetical protein [unclassified Nocardioides]|uniref:hypothetical protein n=1 Tax=unclassified Nocardioides TaxID=2615069 RepID=UPI0036219770
MRSNTVRRNATKIMASVALVAGAAMVAGMGTFGAYTDTTTADAAVSSAKVQILMNGGDNGVSVNAKDLRPGSAIVVPVTVTRGANTSQIDDLLVQTRVTQKNAFSDALRLSVDTCSVPWVVSGSQLTCSGTTTLVAKDAPLGDVQGSTKSWGTTANWITRLNEGNPVHIRATLALPMSAGNATSGLSTDVSWSLTGTLATGGSTVVTPSVS